MNELLSAQEEKLNKEAFCEPTYKGDAYETDESTAISIFCNAR